MGLAVYITLCMTQIEVHRAHKQPFVDGTPSSRILCTPRVIFFLWCSAPNRELCGLGNLILEPGMASIIITPNESVG